MSKTAKSPSPQILGFVLIIHIISNDELIRNVYCISTGYLFIY